MFHLRSGFASVKFQMYLTWKKIIAGSEDAAVLETDKWQSPISKDAVDTMSYVKSCLGTAFQPTDNSIIFAAVLQLKKKLLHEKNLLTL